MSDTTKDHKGAVADMLKAAEELAREHMESYEDPSHDWQDSLAAADRVNKLRRDDRLHVDRVRRTALRLAKSAADGGDEPDMLVVELAALFHDLYADVLPREYVFTTVPPRHDSKYSSQTSDIWTDLNERFFWSYTASGTISQDKARLVCKICENVSYSKETKRIKSGLQTPWHEECIELQCVQDADKLDAIGGIGIMRCAAFSAAKKRPLVQPGNPADAISHFDDKLFKLKDMMRTAEGKRRAADRHQLMVEFVKSVSAELAF